MRQLQASDVLFHIPSNLLFAADDPGHDVTGRNHEGASPIRLVADTAHASDAPATKQNRRRYKPSPAVSRDKVNVTAQLLRIILEGASRMVQSSI